MVGLIEVLFGRLSLQFVSDLFVFPKLVSSMLSCFWRVYVMVRCIVACLSFRESCGV